ncbi:prostaglandin G/H synthase 2-like [Macrobrachium rosenbergii]|uniref:prostaglandin G/H synthase 2-like n=1 Tax=Macrobrachium rosenbergii TaxID=79674 RepID=UPI0034D6F62A
MGWKINPLPLLAGSNSHKNGNLGKPLTCHYCKKTGHSSEQCRSHWALPPKAPYMWPLQEAATLCAESRQSRTRVRKSPSYEGTEFLMELLSIVPGPALVPAPWPQSDLPHGDAKFLPVPLACTEQCQAPFILSEEHKKPQIVPDSAQSTTLISIQGSHSGPPLFSRPGTSTRVRFCHISLGRWTTRAVTDHGRTSTENSFISCRSSWPRLHSMPPSGLRPYTSPAKDDCPSRKGSRRNYHRRGNFQTPVILEGQRTSSVITPQPSSSEARFPKFALGHPFFALLPGLFVYATIWVREHNRVCDELLKIHPNWNDERLYQTARLIITGEVIKITIEDYVQHLSQYKLKLSFEPELVHGTRFQYHNRIHVEFNHLYHWHPLIPDTIEINGINYTIMDMTYNILPIFKHGLDEFIHSMVNNRAGALTNRNHAHVLYPVIKRVIENGRKLRFQSINAYRRKFDLYPFTSFEEMTGDKELAAILESFYGDIEAVEFYVGLLAERPGPSVTPLTMVNIGGPWSVKGLIANPICSPIYWKPSTFGGEEGMNIIRTASLEKLFCLTMKSKCKNIAFTVPEGTL